MGDNGERVEFEEVPEESGRGFDFSSAESLFEDDQGGDSESVKTEGQAITGEIETVEDRAKKSARSVVGLMDIGFGFAGNKSFEESEYVSGERHIAPAMVRLDLRIPALEYFAALLWMLKRMKKSVTELRKRREKTKKDAGAEAAEPGHQYPK